MTKEQVFLELVKKSECVKWGNSKLTVKDGVLQYFSSKEILETSTEREGEQAFSLPKVLVFEDLDRSKEDGEVKPVEHPEGELFPMDAEKALALLSAFPFVGDDETRYFLTGVCIREGHAIATDRHCLYFKDAGFATSPQESGGEYDFILPRSALLVHILKKGQELRYGYEAHGWLTLRFLYKGQEFLYSCSVIKDGKFPNWRRVVPERPPFSFFPRKEDLAALVKELKPLLKFGKYRSCKTHLRLDSTQTAFRLRYLETKVEDETTTNLELYAGVSATLPEAPEYWLFDAGYFLKALAVPSEVVKIEFARDEKTPWMFHYADGAKAIVAPMSRPDEEPVRVEAGPA